MELVNEYERLSEEQEKNRQQNWLLLERLTNLCNTMIRQAAYTVTLNAVELTRRYLLRRDDSSLDNEPLPTLLLEMLKDINLNEVHLDDSESTNA